MTLFHRKIGNTSLRNPTEWFDVYTIAKENRLCNVHETNVNVLNEKLHQLSPFHHWKIVWLKWHIYWVLKTVERRKSKRNNQWVRICGNCIIHSRFQLDQSNKIHTPSHNLRVENIFLNELLRLVLYSRISEINIFITKLMKSCLCSLH